MEPLNQLIGDGQGIYGEAIEEPTRLARYLAATVCTAQKGSGIGQPLVVANANPQVETVDRARQQPHHVGIVAVQTFESPDAHVGKPGSCRLDIGDQMLEILDYLVEHQRIKRGVGLNEKHPAVA